MKKLFTIVAALACTLYGSSQYHVNSYTLTEYGNPGGLNTEIDELLANGSVMNWTPIYGSTSTVAVTPTPTWSQMGTMPFAFNLNGVAVTDYFVSNTGVLTFTSTAPASVPTAANAALPDASIPDNSVCVWGLLGSGANDAVAWKTLGTAPNRQHWVQFNSFSDDAGTANCFSYWAIMFEEGTDKVYIIDRRNNACVNSLTLGIQVDASNAYQVPASPNVGSMTGGDNTPDDNRYYEFGNGNRPGEDMHAVSMVLPEYIDINGGGVTISGIMQNFGSNPVNSYDLNYTVNGGAAVVDAMSPGGTGTNLATNYNATTLWVPSAKGVYTIEVWATNINGNPDANTSNDRISATTTVYDQAFPRIPLVESFTSSTCPPCVQGNINMAGIFNAFPDKQNIVKYQMSWPGSGDPYYTAEGGDRRTYFGINSVPNVWVDAGLGINSQSLTQANIDDAAAVPAFMEINSTYFIDEDNQSVDIDVEINPVTDFPGNNVLMVAIIENETFQNVGTNGETAFDYVMKKMVPGSTGTPIGALTDGTAHTESLSYTFNGDFRLPANASSPITHGTEHSVEEFSDLAVVVWVEDQTTGAIFQSDLSRQLDENGWTVGIEEENTNKIVGLFPNPTSYEANLVYHVTGNQQVSIEVYNTLGAIVYTETPGSQAEGDYRTTINVEGFAKGLYFVKVRVGEEVLVEKLDVK
ncbi:MAG: T9SS type A sorting domain-containing protein [Salibacteraceae bacterium]